MEENVAIEENKKEGGRDIGRCLLYFMIKLIAVVIVVYVVFFHVLGIYKVSGNGMYPRVLDGDLILYSRISDSYHVDDILVYEMDGKTYVGRLKARGGDTIDFSEEKEVLINEAVQFEEVYYPSEKDADSDIKYPLTVDEGCYFLLGDFRTSTTDSRILGEIPEENIKGKVITILRRRGF